MLKAELPPLRMLLVLDNLAGHTTPSFVCWLFDHGIMPLYTPLGGSWLNMTEYPSQCPSYWWRYRNPLFASIFNSVVNNLFMVKRLQSAWSHMKQSC